MNSDNLPDITSEELEKTLTKIKYNKAAGEDILPEMLMVSGKYNYKPFQ